MKNKWDIVGSTGNKYIVSFKNNIFECDCIGFENHSNCYHTKYIKNCVDKKIEPKVIIKRKVNIFYK